MLPQSIRPLTFDFIFVGNEHPIKGIDMLDEILGHCIGNYRFALIGHLPKLEKKYKGVKNFTFFGVRTGQTKKELMDESLVLVLPSYHESFSMVACEALSLGLRVVAFDMPTLWSVYGDDIDYAEYGNWEDMYEKMTSVINEVYKLGGKMVKTDIPNWETEARKVLL